MSQPNAINHDVAARLLGIAPGELDALVKDGAVRRADRNAYSLPVLVQDYIGHLKSENERRVRAPKQAEIAEHLDLSDRSVREFLTEKGMDHRACTLDEIRVAYIRHLREQAAGRAASGDLDLAAERARLAKEQADRLEMINQQTRKELAPVVVMSMALAKVGQQIAGILDALPGICRRRLNLNVEQIEVIQGEMAKARNVVASIHVVLDGDELVPRVEEEVEESVPEVV